MKHSCLYFSLAVSAVLLCSCLNGSSNYTPTITLYSFLHNWQDSVPHSGDTLRLQVSDGGYMLDTVSVGDSVRTFILLQSYTNNLVSFSLDYSDKDLSVVLMVDSILPALDLSKCDVEHGKLVFKPMYNAAGFPIKYYALRDGVAKLTFQVASDAEQNSKVPNSNSLTISQPVR